jgi:hypothetical protein
VEVGIEHIYQLLVLPRLTSKRIGYDSNEGIFSAKMVTEMHEVPGGWLGQEIIKWAMAGLLPPEFGTEIIQLGTAS